MLFRCADGTEAGRRSFRLAAKAASVTLLALAFFTFPSTASVSRGAVPAVEGTLPYAGGGMPRFYSVLHASAKRAEGMGLMDVPVWARSEEICFEAVKASTPQSIRSVVMLIPEASASARIYEEALNKNPGVIASMPPEFIDETLCLEVVMADPLLLHDIPAEYKTERVCIEAVRRNGCTLMFVPEAMRTKKVCIEAVMRSASAMDYVPASLKVSVELELAKAGTPEPPAGVDAPAGAGAPQENAVQ